MPSYQSMYVILGPDGVLRRHDIDEPACIIPEDRLVLRISAHHKDGTVQAPRVLVVRNVLDADRRVVPYGLNKRKGR